VTESFHGLQIGEFAALRQEIAGRLR
jgi:hypothetical protein